MDVLFLDFDGVLNSDNYCALVKDLYGGSLPEDEPLDPFLVQRLSGFLVKNNLAVVFSTNWRFRYAEEQLHSFLLRKGLSPDVQVLGATPWPSVAPYQSLYNAEHRGECVKAWLDDHRNVEAHLVLDDSTDTLDELEWVLTDESRGLSLQDLARAQCQLDAQKEVVS